MTEMFKRSEKKRKKKCLCENGIVTAKSGNAEAKNNTGRTFKTENNLLELS